MIPNYFGQGVLFQLTYIWQVFSNGINFVYDILTVPLKDILSFVPGISDIPIINDVFVFIMDTLGFGDWSLLSVMLGVGLFAYIVVVVVKFFLDTFS